MIKRNGMWRALAIAASFCGLTGLAQVAPAQTQAAPADRGYMGVGFTAVTPEVAKRTGIAPGVGIQVGTLLPGGPAEQIGMRIGDVVLSLGGKPATPENFGSIVAGNRAGGTIDVEFARGAERMTMAIKLSPTRYQVLPEKVLIAGDSRVTPFDNSKLSLRCFTFYTKPGQKWTLRAFQRAVDYNYLPMSISAAENCGENADQDNLPEAVTPGRTWVSGSEYVTERTFVAGGGPYTMLVGASRQSGFKDYSVFAFVAGQEASGWAPTRLSLKMGSQTKLDTASTSGTGASPYKAGQSFTDCEGCPTMVALPAGQGQSMGVFRDH